MATTASTTSVQELYIAYFGRPADAAGLAFYADALDANTTTVAAIAESFGNSTEAATIVAMSTTAYVSAVYLQAFGRAYTLAGDGTFWADAIDAGVTTKESAMVQILGGAQGSDATAVTNKVGVANTYTTTVTSEAKTYSGATAIAAAKEVLSGVTAVASTVTTGNTAASNAVAALASSSADAGTTFTLTTGADTLTGTTLNDQFNAMAGITASAVTDTLTVTDTIDGGAGVDTMTITTTANNDDVTQAALIQNMEVINMRSTAGTAELDADATAGATHVSAYLSAGVVTVTDMAIGAKAIVTGNSSVTNGASNFAMKAAATAQDLTIKGGVTAGAVILTGGGVLTTTIASTGATNVTGALTAAATTTSFTLTGTTKLTAAALDVGAATTMTIASASLTTLASIATTGLLSTLTLTGNGGTTITAALDTDITTVSGGTATGALTLTGSATATVATTLGSGNDSYTTGVALTTGTVDGGGGTDTLALGAVAHANTAALGLKYTNFEALSVNGTFVMSTVNAAIVAVKLSGATNNVTGMSAAQAGAVSGLVDIGATTLGLAAATGTSDVLSLTMGTGVLATEATDLGAMSVDGFETMNVTAVGGATAAVGALFVTDIASFATSSALTNLNLLGSAVNIANGATDLAVAINASALTGDGTVAGANGLTLAGSTVAGTVVTGSDHIDTITIGAEGSTYNLGAGNDSVTTTAAIIAADGTTDAVISGGAGTTDKITITGAMTLTDNNFTNVTGMELLTTAVTTAVSITGLGAATKTAYADGMTVTSGTLANGATYTFGSGIYDKDVTLTLVTAGDGASTADSVSITTGAGADTITVTAAAWVGAAGAAGRFNVNTGAGNDAVTVAFSTIADVTGNEAVEINLGTGADTASLTKVNASQDLGFVEFTVADGDSLIGGRDVITGFDIADGTLFADSIKFTGASIVGNAVLDGTNSGTIKSSTVATGLITFDDVDTFGTALIVNAANLADVTGYLTANFTTAGQSVIFQYDSTNDAAVDSSMVFHAGVGTADSLVELSGTIGTNLATSNATTAGLVDITAA